MKAIISASLLHKELKKVSTVIKERTVMPILQSVKLDFEKERLTINATDLQTSVSVSMPCDAKAKFSVVMDYKDLVKATEISSQPITLTVEDKKITITSDEAKLKFTATDDPKVFPAIDVTDFDIEFEADADFFKSLSRANDCRHLDDMQMNKNAACLDVQKKAMNIVGTDAMCLYRYVVKKDSKRTASVMIPPNFINTVKEFNDATVWLSSGNIRVKYGEVEVVGVLQDSKFLDYTMVFPEEINYNFKCNRADLINAIRTASVTANRSTNIIRIDFNGGEGVIKLASDDADYGKEGEIRIKAQHSVSFPAIGLNGAKMSNLLKYIDDEVVEICFQGVSTPIIMRPEKSPDVFCLLIPTTL